MSNNKSFIKFLSWITILFLALTYVGSLLEFKFSYITSEFLFVIFSGIFASFCVMLLSEIKKYIDNKRASEDMLYSSLLGLYIELTAETKNAEMYLSNPQEIVPSNLFGHRAHVLGHYCQVLRSLDYLPIKQTPLAKQIQVFITNEIPCIDKHISIGVNRLPMAINYVQREYLQRSAIGYNPTSNDQLVKITLQKTKADAMIRLKAVEGLIIALISVYPKRYNWMNDKQAIDAINFDIKEQDAENRAFFETELER